jgi:riboflavin synthase alpha subunit
MKGTRMKITPQVIQFVTDHIAVEEASFVLTCLKMPDGTEVPAINGVCLAVYQKQEKEWYLQFSVWFRSLLSINLHDSGPNSGLLNLIN